MAEYIEKRAVLADLNKTYDKMSAFHPQFYSGYQFAVNLIRNFQTADVAEVRRGEWLLKHIGHGHYWECSVCHINPCIYVTENTKFCPNCGAKMDGGADNGE